MDEITWNTDSHSLTLEEIIKVAKKEFPDVPLDSIIVTGGESAMGGSVSIAPRPVQSTT